LLVVNENQAWLQPSIRSGVDNRIFQLDLSAADFADFKSNVTSGNQSFPQPPEYARHEALPVFQFTILCDLDLPGVDTAEPATQPVIACVIHDIQERRACNNQADRLIRQSIKLLCTS